MSIDTARPPARSTVRATATWLFGINLYLAAWFWGIVIVCGIASLVVIDRFTTVSVSVVSLARQGGIWFPFSVIIATTAAYLPVHVAAGLTRRALALGSIVSALGTAVVYGVVLSGLLLVERAVFDALGWTWQPLEALSPNAGGTASVVVSSTMVFTVAYVSGLLVAITYQRAGGWWATLALPFTAGPILLVSAMFAQDAGPFSTSEWFGGDQPLLVASVVAVLIAAVMAVAFDRLVRGAPVPSRTT